MPSTPMIVVAPDSFAPAVAHSPIGPCANTATVSPMRISPLSAPQKPVDMMSGHISTCSSVSSSGTGARFAMASGTSTYSAWQPSMVLPKRQPPIALKPCFVPAPSCDRQPHRQAADVPARRDRAGDDALALAVALNRRAELFDDADRLMADGEARARRDIRPSGYGRRCRRSWSS